MNEGQAEFPPDEYTGIGGTYLRDPATGKRTPAPQDNTTESPLIISEDMGHGSEKQ